MRVANSFVGNQLDPDEVQVLAEAGLDHDCTLSQEDGCSVCDILSDPEPNEYDLHNNPGINYV